MTNTENLTRDNFETVYKVYHKDERGFGGASAVWVAVEEEDEDEIRGRIATPHPYTDLPGERITIRKENVAGWEVDLIQYKEIRREP